MVLGERHAPGEQILHGRQADGGAEALEEGGAGESRFLSHAFDRPVVGGIGMQPTQADGQAFVGKTAQDAGWGVIARHDAERSSRMTSSRRREPCRGPAAPRGSHRSQADQGREAFGAAHMQKAWQERDQKMGIG